MITLNMLGTIRRLHFRDGLSISELSRRTGLARNTIKRWLRSDEGAEPKYERKDRPTILSPYVDRLTTWLEADARRAKRERRTALALFGNLQQLGFTGSYPRVSEYVRRWRDDSGKVAKAAFIPLQFEFGEAFQFDWSEESLIIGGFHRKWLVAHTKLCARRAFLLAAYPTQSHEMLFDAHTRAFRVFGGLPRRGIYDNMKTAVDKVGVGKRRIVNTRFAAMASHDLFDPDFCHVASGGEKGVVEKNVQDSRRRLWQDAGNHRFGSFAELNVWLEARCQALWAELPYPDVDHLTIADALTMERDTLMPMVPAFDGDVEAIASVSSPCLVSIERNQYSVPCAFANQKLSVRLYPDRIEAHDEDGIVALHERSFERGEVRDDWRHYIQWVERKPGALRNGAPFDGLPAVLQRLRAALIKRLGGDRLMADVLACVPKHGLELVLVAAELILEAGHTRAEHIKNVLSRLKEAPPPDTVETALTVEDPPMADAGRYDRLREEVGHA
ncbi:MAG TPA: IS21 family transposase [Accumulibacter sp.]|uniref:IS21 family transposase n=1 Tax=Accumulibacter sp. TaxID=2053492 RepID=UPI002BE249B4|nr:IS21 family transposase [Accumulibacter sp.]HRD90994.1 IS21 family transposase [Accumulibacter sp.]